MIYDWGAAARTCTGCYTPPHYRAYLLPDFATGARRVGCTRVLTYFLYSMLYETATLCSAVAVQTLLVFPLVRFNDWPGTNCFPESSSLWCGLQSDLKIRSS